MATQEFNDGIAAGLIKTDRNRNPHCASEDFESHRAQFFDWLAGWDVGYAKSFIAPFEIPIAPIVE